MITNSQHGFLMSDSSLAFSFCLALDGARGPAHWGESCNCASGMDNLAKSHFLEWLEAQVPYSLGTGLKAGTCPKSLISVFNFSFKFMYHLLFAYFTTCFPFSNIKRKLHPCIDFTN